MRPARLIYGLATSLVCVGAVESAFLDWHVPILALLGFIVVVTVTETATVRMVIGRQGYSVSLTETFIAVAFVIAPGAWVMIGLIAAVFFANFRRAEPIKLAFNLAQYAAAVGAGLLVTRAIGDEIMGAAAGLAVFAVLNHFVVAIPIAIVTARSYFNVVSQISTMAIIHQAGNISLGLLAAWMARNAAWGLLGLVAPLFLLWWSYHQQTERAAEARLFAELSRGQDEASSNSLETSARVIITSAARLFGGAEVEMLLRHPDGPVHYVGDEDGINKRERANSDAFASPWVLRTMGARGVLTGSEDEQPYCSAVLGDPERPLAVLIARRPVKAAPFERLDARLAQVLVGQAEAWLSVADLATRHGAAVDKANAYGESAQALGDLGASTAPSLVVLRESAERLSRLAYSFNGPDPMREIIDELHSTERAVASLLGAIALTTDPELVTGVEAAPTADKGQVDSEWTTTGRMDMSDLR